MAISIFSLMASFCHACAADIVALQEINVNPASAAGFVAGWRAQGYACILGDLDPSNCLHRVALLARCPIQQVSLQVPAGQARCAAGYVEVFGNGFKQCVLLASFYGQSGDLAATSLIFSELLVAVQRFGGPFAILGDFNCTVEEAPVAPHLASGVLRSLDDDLSAGLPNTNPVNTRRIDFALAHRSLHANGGETVRRRDLSDHGIVSYCIPVELHPAGHHAPRFAALPCTEPDVIALAFESIWNPVEFASCLQAADVEGAWRMFSDKAEEAMGSDLSQSPQRRSMPWQPLPSIASHHRCNRDGHHSASVYDLGRLKARVHQLRAQPHSQALRCKILRSLSQLRRRIPVLPFISLVDLDGAVQIVDDLYDQLSSQEQNARIQKWRDDHYRSSAACFSWIRQRSRVAEALHQASDAVPAQAIHSAEVVRVQSALWTAKWNPDTPINFASLECLLGHFRQPAPESMHLSISAHQLRRACAKMNGKAPGPDGWTALQLGLLPLTS